jgi:hypothetical protein
MNINEIIKEEINILNESQVFQDNSLVFKETINNSEFVNYDSLSPNFDSNILESSITIHWNISFWVNEFGIENFIIGINNVEGSFVVELHDKHSDELMQKNTKDINTVQWKFNVENGNLMKGGSLYVQHAYFDFSTNICTISF